MVRSSSASSTAHAVPALLNVYAPTSPGNKISILNQTAARIASEPPPVDSCGCDASGGNGMVLRRNVVIPNSRGLHARAAAKLVSTAERFSAFSSRIIGAFR